jgi:ABC-type branched-subunit amino acid transport system substrate-binding protein
MPSSKLVVRAGALAGGLALALTAAGLAATRGSGSADVPAPLVVAVEGPQSGDQASNGLDMLRGVRLAVNQLNAAGGLWDGRKVVVDAADDKGDAANAVPVARGVIAKGIRFVIGPYNSSVGIANLRVYRRGRVLPLWMSSRDETAGLGATVQPMNSQIAPVEERYVNSLGAKRVTMLVDDTPDGAFTKGMAMRLRAALEEGGTSVTWISVVEASSEANPGDYFAGKVSEAMASSPDLVYVSTYFPEGVYIAKALSAAGTAPQCLMGLANVDTGFVDGTTLQEAQRCVFSGVPAATEMPTARAYVQQYRRAFGKTPGVWGTFTYDSAKLLFAAINRAKSYGFFAVEQQLRHTKAFPGATGSITIDSSRGVRTNVPVSILRVSPAKRFVIASTG